MHAYVKSMFTFLIWVWQIKMDNPALGKNSGEITESVGKIMNEVNIMKEQVTCVQ